MMANICVINDDAVNCALLADLISDRGDDVMCCDSTEAFGCLERGPVDLVVIDLMTTKPEGGWDLLTFLQLHPRLRTLPTIVVSAITEELLSKEEWLGDHRIGVLVKPFDLDDLYEYIDTALARRATPQR